MQTNIASRLTLIGVVLLVGLLGIFWPPLRLLDTSIPVREKLNLRPGLDIAGGTALLYEIKAPPGSREDLAERVASVLKRRVDPEGVRNLIWRPQGANRIEIQMPASPKAEEARQARDRFTQAQKNLDAVAIRRSQIEATMALPADQRPARLAQLSAGSPWLKSLLDRMAALTDDFRKAEAANDTKRIVEVLEPMEKDLWKEFDAASVSVPLLQKELELRLAAVEKAQKAGNAADGQKRRQDYDAKVQEFIAKAPDFPARTQAIREFAAALTEYSRYKGTVDDAEDLKRLLRGSGVLEFRIAVTNTSTPEAQAMVQRMKPGGRGPTPVPGDTMRWYELDRPDEVMGQSLVIVDYQDKKWILISIKPEDSMVHREGGADWGLQRAFPDIDSRTGRAQVGFEFDAQGGKLFAELTQSHLKQPLAIVLDDKIISAPTIQSRIEGRGVITGDRSEKDREYLINTLNAGSLPARLADDPISERTIGPQLGEDNLRAGLVACMIGLIVVAVFLVGYYYRAGVVAMIAVTMNLVIILGVMAAFNATFTLPGIAALVLTVGMAVDANVLIFERLREEQLRGLSLRLALHNAYDRAFSAILDSNVTTAITSLVLYWLGSEEVKGFGLTLLIGIVTSLFTALFVTRTLFIILIEKMHIRNLGSLPLSFPRWDRALRPNIDWMGKAWIFIAVSSIITVVGLGAFFSRGRQMFDIEFVSGTGVQFELKQPMERAAVQKLVDPFEQKGLPGAAVVSVGDDRKSYEIVTPNPDASQVKDAVMRALGDKINVVQPSKFQHAGEPVEQAIAAKAVIAIVKDHFAMLRSAGVADESLLRNEGGAAILLADLDPPLSAAEISLRLDRARLQPDRVKEPYRKIEVQVAPGTAATAPVRSAVVLVSDEALSYAKVPDQWKGELARPLWSLVSDAINRPAELQKVTNFDAQVAEETMRDGVMALVVAMLLIMIYIWFRFGNLKYATATVVALLHDALITVGAIGLSHYLAGTVFGSALMIEPFRMNLTLLAAVLTVMGYSMNDTVVVFDRIRENRGKFGHVSRQIINDSINQTLSRTLLTGGTTLVTILFMYITGGAGVHGFTFALLVGILVGTYSSIAIASPILLLGREQAEVRRATIGQVQEAGG